MLESKLASAIEENCTLHGQLDNATRHLEVAQVDTQRKIHTLGECHNLDLANVHFGYAAQAAEHKECSAMILRV